MEDGRYGLLGGKPTKSDYPQYEIKVIYDCQLCKIRHAAIIRVKGSAGEDSIRGYMAVAKRQAVCEFFKNHPKAKVEDFDLGKISAVETKTFEADEDPEIEKLGVSMIKEEVESYRREFFKESEKVEEKSKEEAPKEVDEITKIEEAGPLETGSELPMDFDKLTNMVEKRLKVLREKESKLELELASVRKEKEQFEKLYGVATK